MSTMGGALRRRVLNWAGWLMRGGSRRSTVGPDALGSSCCVASGFVAPGRRGGLGGARRAGGDSGAGLAGVGGHAAVPPPRVRSGVVGDRSPDLDDELRLSAERAHH